MSTRSPLLYQVVSSVDSSDLLIAWCFSCICTCEPLSKPHQKISGAIHPCSRTHGLPLTASLNRCQLGSRHGDCPAAICVLSLQCLMHAHQCYAMPTAHPHDAGSGLDALAAAADDSDSTGTAGAVIPGARETLNAQMPDDEQPAGAPQSQPQPQPQQEQSRRSRVLTTPVKAQPGLVLMASAGNGSCQLSGALRLAPSSTFASSMSGGSSSLQGWNP